MIRVFFGKYCCRKRRRKRMEGLIPFVYKAIMQYKQGQQGPIGTWLNECDSPSASYMRLPGDSGRFQVSDLQIFLPEYGFSSNTSSTSSSSSTKRMVTGGVQSPASSHLNSRPTVKWLFNHEYKFTGVKKESRRACDLDQYIVMWW